MRARVEGVLIGLAAGDRIGGPLRMALCLAESLVERRGFDVGDVGSRYLAWWKQGAFDTGPTAARALSLAASGMAFKQAVTATDSECHGMTAGCAPAHRCVPLAMVAEISDERLAYCAMQEAVLTHKHVLAGDVSAAVAVLCRALIRRSDWEAALRQAQVGRLAETQAAMSARSLESLNRCGFAPDVLAAAVHFLSEAHDFNTALDAALGFAGPANYCPVLVGAIGGARWGAARILLPHLAHCAVMGRVRDLAASLADEW